MASLFRRGTKTCIVTREEEGLTYFIPLCDTGLAINTLGGEEFVSLGWVAVQYEIKLAAERYLSFGNRHGITQEALEELLKIVREGEVPVDERKVYSNGNQAIINISAVNGPNINFVGILNNKLDLISLSQKEFKQYKELKNKVKDFAKQLLKFAEIEGVASKSALRLLREVIKGGSIINIEEEFEMAKKKEAPEGATKVEKAKPGKSLMAGKKEKVVKAEKAEKVSAGQPEAPAKRGRKAADTSWLDSKHIVTDPEKVKRGFIKEYVDFAATKKTGFKLQDLVKKFCPEYPEERITRYFEWCRAKAIFQVSQ